MQYFVYSRLASGCVLGQAPIIPLGVFRVKYKVKCTIDIRNVHLVLEGSYTLSMEEMYKMSSFKVMLLYAISVIVQCDENIKM